VLRKVPFDPLPWTASLQNETLLPSPAGPVVSPAIPVPKETTATGRRGWEVVSARARSATATYWGATVEVNEPFVVFPCTALSPSETLVPPEVATPYVFPVMIVFRTREVPYEVSP
jgi:hypothetical protein